MNFVIGNILPQEENSTTLWFLFDKSNLLIKEIDNRIVIPESEDIDKIMDSINNQHYIGSLEGHPCYAASCPDNLVFPEGMKFYSLRKLFGIIDESLFWAASRALQIVDWDVTHKFCGACGTTTTKKVDENAKVCPNCGLISYPRISPAIIVAITRGDEILLAKNKGFRANFYSVIAGFVEPGETLEECLKREVREEVGIEVKSINYFGSQPWPFPNSLMVGFTAEYDKGEIIIGEDELLEAAWYTVDNLPPIPNKISIAGRLIDWFIHGNDNA